MMPLFVKADPDGRQRGEGVFVEARPEWRDRDLHPDETGRCGILVMAFLAQNGFTYRQIAQVLQGIASEFSPEVPLGTARSAVENRLRSFRKAAREAGFVESPVPA